MAGQIITVAMTGASGAVFGRHVLQALEADERVSKINFVASGSALRVLAEELDVRGKTGLVEKLLGKPSTKTEHLSEKDIGANIASGSYPSSAMIIIPCSMGTLAGIANGSSTNLIQRAADVSLKERRPLILCVRETPFNKIHLRNMSAAADAGAVIYPVIPSFYQRPTSVDDLVAHYVNRVLSSIGLPQASAYVWKPDG